MKEKTKENLIGCSMIAGFGLFYFALVGISIAVPVMIVVWVLRFMGVL